MLGKALLALALSASALGAQQPQQPLGYKDPGTATVLSVVVPGGGQLYVGDAKKGGMILGVSLGGLILGTALSASSCADLGGSCSTAPLALGLVAFLGGWIYGIVDAPKTAEKHNAALKRSALGSIEPVIARARGGGTTQLGLRIAVR